MAQKENRTGNGSIRGNRLSGQPSLKKNIAISTIYQVLLIILPIITAPYVARVLGPDQSGIYDYTNSIQTYFAMFAALGTASYGAREVSRVPVMTLT